MQLTQDHIGTDIAIVNILMHCQSPPREYELGQIPPAKQLHKAKDECRGGWKLVISEACEVAICAT